MKLKQLILSTVAFLGLGLAQAATIVALDNTTALTDGTTFSAGDVYFAAFHLTGSGSAITYALVSNLNLGGGSPIAFSGLRDGFVLVDPASDPLAPWVPGGTVRLMVDSTNSYSIFTQAFTAGSTFSFEALLGGLINPNAPYPDQFAFQLYRDGVETGPAYEVILTPDGSNSPVPEPGTWVLMSAGLGAVVLRRRCTR